MRIAACLTALLLSASSAFAQSDAVTIRDDVPIDTYLALLAQVAPPIRASHEKDTASLQRLGSNIACPRS